MVMVVLLSIFSERFTEYSASEIGHPFFPHELLLIHKLLHNSSLEDLALNPHYINGCICNKHNNQRTK